MPIPSSSDPRVRTLRDTPPEPKRPYVLYWMIGNRRLEWNHALDRALEWARALGRPLVILEPLRVDYPWVADRHHAFVLDGMREHRRRLRPGPVAYHAYVEPEPGDGRGLLGALSRDACVTVTDDAPTFFLPRLLEAGARACRSRLEAVDGCGLLPLSEVDRPFTSAYHFRRFLQRALPAHLTRLPDPSPLEGLDLPRAEIPEQVRTRWLEAPDAMLEPSSRELAALPIDHGVGRSPFRGGASAGRRRLEDFIEKGLSLYAETRNDPDAGAASGLSPWLHFGHVSPHEIFHRIARREGWSPARLGDEPSGKRHGWWGMSAGAEAFLDELVTWRELGYGFCRVTDGYDRYESLPSWARETLDDHASDPRPHLYDVDAFDRASTHDELWNAAQRQLREDGVIQGYLRMLWGKKILEWSASPREALRIMIELNNRYAVDGRDPNSYSGIMWVLGRFDRGWPERPIYGKVRSMSSEQARKKLSLERYLDRWGGQDALPGFNRATPGER